MNATAAWPVVHTDTAAVAAPPPAALTLLLPSGARLPLGERCAIGLAAENDVVLSDPWVSRRHCVVERVAGALVLRDLGSKNGTFVNDVRVQETALQSGAVIGVGRSRLRVVPPQKGSVTLVGDSAVMRGLRRRIGVLGPTKLPLLIVGETGTGKELVARGLHDESARTGAFVALNCGAIAAELVESELFGHEKGAFTGATQKRVGVFQEADGGTLFLDEIGELPLSLQPRLLRALEIGAVRPVGSAREQRVDVRVIAATHVDLEEAVRRGRFREDLYYRLCGDLLRTPNLREHPEDLPQLAARLLADEGRVLTLEDDALAALRAHPWPGNVRELRNVLRRAAVLGGPSLRAADLQLKAVEIETTSDLMPIANRPFLDLEREILSRALRRSGGNKRAAAHALGIPKSTLCDKAKRYGLG